MNNLQSSYRFQWQTITRKITFAISLYTSLLISYDATAATSYSLPLTIQAENYSAMRGIKTAATTDAGGGLSVAWTDTRDWLSYSTTPVNIPTTGNYKITYRLASTHTGSSFIFRETNNGTIYDRVAVPETGNWQTWESVTRTITLTAGVHTFGFTVITGGFNFNWFEIETASTSSFSSSLPAQPTSAVTSSIKPTASSAAASSQPATSKAASSSKPSTTSVVSAQIIGPVAISWGIPKLRENGSGMDITELGGYQLRYKLLSDSEFTYITINDPWTTTYNFSWLDGNYIFQIAAFDKNGQYSDFVNILEK